MVNPGNEQIGGWELYPWRELRPECMRRQRRQDLANSAMILVARRNSRVKVIAM